MITRKKLLAELTQKISDSKCQPDHVVAEIILDLFSIKVILPMIDAFDFDSRPLFRELLINSLRDLMAQEQVVEVENTSRDFSVPNE